MKKAIPVIIAILLILIIGGGYAAAVLVEKYSYSTERMDLNEYFKVTGDNSLTVVLQDERADFRAVQLDGYCYFDLDTVHEQFNRRFFWDATENLLIYTEALGSTTAYVGERGYITEDGSVETPYIPAVQEGDTLYVACDYIKLFTNYSYNYYEEPARMQVYTEWNSRNIAYISKDTQIRYRGGVKSEILKDINEGDKVQVLEEYDDWAQVRTEDCFIGYVEKKRLTDYSTEEPIPVTDYVEPEFTSIGRDYKINLVWHNVAAAAGNDTFYSLTAQSSGINVISPTWFGLSDNYGGISDFGSAAYVTAAHERGMEVWGLVSNFVTRDIDTYEVLSKTTSRTALVNNLMEAVNKYELDGINVDFEDLSVASGEPFIQFIRELSVRCRKEEIVLSIDNYVPLGNTDYYNRGEQGVFADYVIIMGYDEHYAGSSEAGSVASIDYVEKGITKTLEEVPASKVINAVPFYTRIWETSGDSVSSQAVGMATANKWVEDHGVVLSWDNDVCQHYGEYTSGQTRYQVWLEDAESIEVKLSVMDTHGLAGVAAWCLGFETSDIWNVIGEYTGQ